MVVVDPVDVTPIALSCDFSYFNPVTAEMVIMYSEMMKEGDGDGK